VLGAATGLRTTVGMAALTSPRAAPGAFLGRPAVRALAAVAFGGELVYDKVPSASSRLEPPALAARALFAGLGALALARAADQAAVPAVLVAAAAALVAARVGHDARAALAARLPALAAAAAEDAAAVALAALAAG